MKILLIHNFYREPGGEDIVFEQERRLLERNGHHVITYTRSNDEAENSTLMDRLHLLKTIVWASDSRKDIENILLQERPDLVHIHNTFMMISPSIFDAIENAKVPCIQTVHNYRLMCPAAYLFRDGMCCEECITGGLMSGIYHGCYRNSRSHTAAVATMLKVHRMRGTWRDKVTGFIALTQFGRQKLIDVGVAPDKIHVKPNSVDVVASEREGHGEYALFVGRISPEKGVATLLKAWELMSARVPLKIVGDGPELTKLKALVPAEGLGTIEFLGRLDRTRAGELMRKARFLVVPSIWYEGFPLVIAEAFASGVPVLASRLGALEELVSEGITGLTFRAGSPEDLAAKASWAWENPDAMLAMGRNAKRTFQLSYRPDENYRMLMDIYNEATSRARAPL
jgi:glycosyltransferase involved in cell wall biosynthesis